MKIDAVKGTTIYVSELSGQSWRFAMLAPRDLYEIQRMAPVPSHRGYPRATDLMEWTATFEGADQVILRSLRHEREGVELEDVWKIGSPAQRVQLARRIFDETAFYGSQDIAADVDEGQKKRQEDPATG